MRRRVNNSFGYAARLLAVSEWCTQDPHRHRHTWRESLGCYTRQCLRWSLHAEKIGMYCSSSTTHTLHPCAQANKVVL